MKMDSPGRKVLIVQQTIYLSLVLVIFGSSLSLKSLAGTTPVFHWKKEVVFTDLPDTGFKGNDYSSVTYHDILAHTDNKEVALKIGGALPVNAHENIHHLNSMLRNLFFPKNVEAVYAFHGHGIVIDQPRTKAKDIRDRVSAEVKSKGYIYENYLVKYLEQTAADTSFLMIFNEWSATVGGARVAVEVKKASTLPDSHVRCQNVFPEEWLYIVAVGLDTLRRLEPEYLETGKQLKSAFQMLAEQTASIRLQSMGISVFTQGCRDKLDHFDHLGQAQENKAIREGLAELFGTQWTKTVLGF
jgi:hypothetical protein